MHEDNLLIVKVLRDARLSAKEIAERVEVSEMMILRMFSELNREYKTAGGIDELPEM